jgi:Yip1 domain
MTSQLLTFVRGVLTFDDATYSVHVASRDALKRGLLLMVVVALLIGLFPFLSGIANSFRRVDVAAMQGDIERQIEQRMQFNPAWQDPEFRQVFNEYFPAVFAIVRDIAAVKPNVSFLPDWLDRLLHAFGAWLSTPLAWLGAWAWYALWVTLFAKLLGGRATLERMLAATTLTVVPHLLDVLVSLIGLLSGIPFVGACFGVGGWVIGLAAWVWGIAVYVKATATANEFGLDKASLATILPALLVLLLMFVLLIAFIILLVVAGSR